MLLINSSPQNALKIFQPFLPIFVPIGLGYLVAACREQGVPVNFLDEQVEDRILEKVVQSARNMSPPYIFGFSVLTAALKRALDLARDIKARYPDSVVVFGGIHPTARPDEVLAYDQVDLVLGGEAEQTLVELYHRVKGGQDYTHIPGLSYKKNGRIKHNPWAGKFIDLDRLPPFPYELFNRKPYNLGFVISSRGCPYNCIFCSNRIVTGKKYRYLSAENIADTLEMLYHRYQQTFVLFLDDNFLVNKERIYRLLEEIRRRGLHQKMTFSFQGRGDNADYRLLKEMYACGFKSVFFGMETASERLMQIIKKGETVEQCIRAVKMAKDLNFHVSATFIFGLPTENHADRLDAIRLARDLRLDQVRFNNATPYPGTELYHLALDEQRLKVQGLYENFISVSTFIENPFQKTPFSYVPSGNTEKDIRADILFGYLYFYLDLKKLKAIFLKPKQGVGWFSSGEKLVEFLKKIPALAFLNAMLAVKFGQLLLDILGKKTAPLPLKEVWRGLLGR
ncbi:MAG: radical SAM protein [Thermodesulfobacteriota bacterium]